MNRCCMCLLGAATIIGTPFAPPRDAGASVYTFTFARALPAPGGNCFSISYADDATLWVHNLATHTMFQIAPSNGAVIRSFPSDANTMTGIAIHGGIIYGSEEPAIVRFDEALGTQLASTGSPIIGGTRGVTFVGSNLYGAGVITGFPGQVRLAHLDPATGALLGSCAPAGLVNTSVVGAIGPYACFFYSDPTNEVLRIVDPTTGALLEDHPLFPTGFDNFYGIAASGTELFVSRRDLDQIWVYSIEQPVAARATTWGAIQALYH